MKHMPRFALSALLCALLPAVAGAQDAPAAAPDAGPAAAVKVAERIAPSLVKIEYRYRVLGGEQPRSMSGRYANWVDGRIRQAIDQARPVWGDGYLLAPDLLVTADLMVPERFLESIRIHFGEASVAATAVGYARRQNAVFLRLEQPLAGTKPLSFAEGPVAGPHWVVAYDKGPWAWLTRVFPLGGAIWAADTGERAVEIGADAVIVGADGQGVGACFTGELHLERDWRGSPTAWPQVDAAALAGSLQRLEAGGAAALLRARLTFRSPKARGAMQRMMMMGRGDEDELTEWNGVAVVVGERRALVLADLEPKQTARLERVDLFVPGAAEPLEGAFAGSLKDYGALVVSSAAPLPTPAKLAGGDVRLLRDTLLTFAEVLVQGEERVVHLGRTWFTQLEEGRGELLHPGVPEATAYRQQDYRSQQGGRQGVFTFTLEGELVALPLARRQPVTVRERWSNPDVKATPASALARVLAELEEHLDPNNVPVAEGEEDKLAWLGVELQQLDADLARANGVAHLTQNGAQGALVVYVYEGSPAERVGIQMGDVLLRLQVEGQPKPLEVRMDHDPSAFMGAFPWDQLDQVPEQYFDQIPAPWPPVETSLTRSLTDIGFGTKFVAEVARAGDVLALDMTIEAGPHHFHSAPRHEAKALGLTAADMTYEVRRYLQRTPDEPGVVIAKVTMGSKASIAGIKPYELITHVNDEPVQTVKDLERLLAPGGELRLSIKRMHRGRIAKVDLPPAGAEEPEEEAAPPTMHRRGEGASGEAD